MNSFLASIILGFVMALAYRYYQRSVVIASTASSSASSSAASSSSWLSPQPLTNTLSRYLPFPNSHFSTTSTNRHHSHSNYPSVIILDYEMGKNSGKKDPAVEAGKGSHFRLFLPPHMGNGNGNEGLKLVCNSGMDLNISSGGSSGSSRLREEYRVIVPTKSVLSVSNQLWPYEYAIMTKERLPLGGNVREHAASVVNSLDQMLDCNCASAQKPLPSTNRATFRSFDSAYESHLLGDSTNPTSSHPHAPSRSMCRRCEKNMKRIKILMDDYVDLRTNNVTESTLAELRNEVSNYLMDYMYRNLTVTSFAVMEETRIAGVLEVTCLSCVGTDPSTTNNETTPPTPLSPHHRLLWKLRMIHGENDWSQYTSNPVDSDIISSPTTPTTSVLAQFCPRLQFHTHPTPSTPSQ